ncbi:hypothetical protein [Nitrosopumilus sp.]|uniref:hypothetical protein n=1 Tax=Nitrosopumilus sp. TaxID=2024843 RepID=UPI00262C6FEC|nr:hypothetical protein [Nitrosopumilus sp.]
MKKTIYFTKSYPETVTWKKEIEIKDGKVVDETFWRISDDDNDPNPHYWPISDSDELLLIKNEIDAIQRRILEGVSSELEDELEQSLDVLRKRRFSLLSNM